MMTEEIIAIGGQITADSLLAGYSAGVFPMWVDVADSDPVGEVLAWFAPDPRAVLVAPGMKPSRSLRRSMRGFTCSIDAHFDEVLEGCADPNRPHGWIGADYRRAYVELHHRGAAHSVEILREGQLVGGLLGVEIGGLFCAESMFHRVTDASKAAVFALSSLMFSGKSNARRVIDAQWLTPHLASLGFRGLTRRTYANTIAQAIAAPSAFSSEAKCFGEDLQPASSIV